MLPISPDPERRGDYAHCLKIARHAENFPVASRLLPPAFRPHLAAIYAFARGADDLADEPSPRLGERSIAPDRASRLAALDEWERALDGRVPVGVEPVFRALAATRATCSLEVRPLRDLLVAFRWDVERSGYHTWADLRRYADHSAAPIGRLVLALAGVRDPALVARSDDLCVALQLTNFWQDLSIDWPRGRLYLPEELWAGEDLDREALDSLARGRPIRLASLPSPARTALADGLREAIRRTEELFDRARDLPSQVGAPLDIYLTAVWYGGHTVLERVRRLDARAFERRPSLGVGGRLSTLSRALVWARFGRARARPQPAC